MRELDIPRQQVVDIIVAFDMRPLIKQAHQVVNRLHVIGFGGFDQAIKHRTGIGTAMGVGEQPGFAAYHERFDGALRAVVVDVDAAIGGIPPKYLTQAVH